HFSLTSLVSQGVTDDRTGEGPPGVRPARRRTTPHEPGAGVRGKRTKRRKPAANPTPDRRWRNERGKARTPRAPAGHRPRIKRRKRRKPPPPGRRGHSQGGKRHRSRVRTGPMPRNKRRKRRKPPTASLDRKPSFAYFACFAHDTSAGHH